MTMSQVERRIFKHMAYSMVFMGLFILWFWVLDPALRPVIDYRHYDPMDIQLEKEVYSQGENVWAYFSICKLRDAGGTLSWNLMNDRIIPYAPVDISEFPSGYCSPTIEFDENGNPNFSLFMIARIPDDALPGEHVFVGVGNNTLSMNRVVKNNYQTETFIVE